MLRSTWKRFLSPRLDHCRMVSKLKSKSESVNEPKIKKLDSNKKKASKELLEYIAADSSLVDVLKKLPPILLKNTKMPAGLYLINENTAETIAKVLKTNLSSDQTLIEANPGIGFLTKHLIKETKNDLQLFEPIEEFHNDLADLISQQPKSNTILKHIDLSTLWKIAFLDSLDKGHRVDLAFKGLTRSDYEDPPKNRIFIATGSSIFIRYLINSHVFQTGLSSYGRSEFYFCLTPNLARTLTCSNEAGYILYRAYSVLFQIFFEHEFICELDRKHFLPWTKISDKKVANSKMHKFNIMNPDSLFLMRVIPRQDLFRNVAPDNLPALWYFVKQHLMGRKNRVIPSLERWIPGCGPRLIVNRKPTVSAKLNNPNLDISTLPKLMEPSRTLSNEDFLPNMNIFTEFGDLSPSQVLTLFDQFINWPEYQECAFSASLENALMKASAVPDDQADDLEHEEEEEHETVK